MRSCQDLVTLGVPAETIDNASCCQSQPEMDYRAAPQRPANFHKLWKVAMLGVSVVSAALLSIALLAAPLVIIGEKSGVAHVLRKIMYYVGLIQICAAFVVGGILALLGMKNTRRLLIPYILLEFIFCLLLYFALDFTTYVGIALFVVVLVMLILNVKTAIVVYRYCRSMEEQQHASSNVLPERIPGSDEIRSQLAVTTQSPAQSPAVARRSDREQPSAYEEAIAATYAGGIGNVDQEPQLNLPLSEPQRETQNINSS